MGDKKKKWYKSKGVWGGVLTFVVSIISVWYNVDVSQKVIEQASAHMVELITAATGLLALIGRVVADSKIE